MADSSFKMISSYFDIEFPEDSSALVYICARKEPRGELTSWNETVAPILISRDHATLTVPFYRSLRQQFHNTADPNETISRRSRSVHAGGDGGRELLRSGNSRKSSSAQEIFKFNSNVDAINRDASRGIFLGRQEN